MNIISIIQAVFLSILVLSTSIYPSSACATETRQTAPTVTISYINQTQPSNNEISDIRIKHNWSVIIVAFWFFGLMLGLTACALPLILIMTSVISSSVEKVTKFRALTLSFTYILSLAITYSIIGTLVALCGSYLQAYLNNNWVLIVFSFLYLILALSSLDLFRIQFSSHFLSAIAAHSKLSNYSPYVETVFLGILATLIAFPCIAAPLLGALAYIANLGDMKLGAVALFCVGIGLGTPLLVINTISSNLLVMAGEWQKEIKHFFGLVLLSVSIWLLTHIIPAYQVMFLWSMYFIFTAIYMDTLINDDSLNNDSDAEAVVCSLDGNEVQPTNIKRKNFITIIRMICMMLLIYGVVLFIGALLGNENPLAPFSQQPTQTIRHEI